MAAKRVKVIYQDGRTETVRVLPRAQVMTEQHFNGMNSENMMAIGFHLGWAALVVLKKETLDYETWLDRIEDIELDPEEDPEQPDEEVPPTPPVQSGDVSSE